MQQTTQIQAKTYQLLSHVLPSVVSSVSISGNKIASIKTNMEQVSQTLSQVDTVVNSFSQNLSQLPSADRLSNLASKEDLQSQFSTLSTSLSAGVSSTQISSIERNIEAMSMSLSSVQRLSQDIPSWIPSIQGLGLWQEPLERLFSGLTSLKVCRTIGQIPFDRLSQELLAENAAGHAAEFRSVETSGNLWYCLSRILQTGRPSQPLFGGACIVHREKPCIKVQCIAKRGADDESDQRYTALKYP